MGHTSRVLFLAMSPDGETIVTGAGDETLRFWNVFPKKGEAQPQQTLLTPLNLRWNEFLSYTIQFISKLNLSLRLAMNSLSHKFADNFLIDSDNTGEPAVDTDS